MQWISVPRGSDPKFFFLAPREMVPAFGVFGGLAVTPSVTRAIRFTITHTATGCAVPSLSDLSLDTAMAIGEILGAAFPWGEVDDIFFFRTLSPTHQEALRGCILALREMFGVE